MIHQKMKSIKKELQGREIKKSGKNTFQGFKYHELSDIVPHIIELNERYGVDETIQITPELCRLELTDVEDGTSKVVTVPYVAAEMTQKTDPIQRLGATVTYIRRYLYLTAYSIVENDIVDSMEQVTRETKATSKQKEIILNGDPERVMKALEYYKVKAVEDLTATQASKIIEQFSK